MASPLAAAAAASSSSSSASFLISPPSIHTGNSRNRIRKIPIISNQIDKYASFSSSLGTDLPLHEHPQVPFQTYLQDRQRVFEALFPDKKRYKKLTDTEWRVYMLPLDFLFLSVNPVVDMQIRVQTPTAQLAIAVPKHVDRVLTLEATQWELRGLDYMLKPSDFVLSINGLLYSEKRGISSRLKGHLKFSVKFAIPPSMAMIPQEAFRSVGEAVLNQLLESMKEKVNNKLLEDYRAYAREYSRNTSNSVVPSAT